MDVIREVQACDFGGCFVIYANILKMEVTGDLLCTIHFSLFYTINVQILYTICTLLKLYINVHWVSSGKKYKGYRFKTSQLSTIVAGISKHSNHLGFKNPSFFCDVLWIPNVAESFSDEILHHGSCNSFTEIKKAVIDHLKQVFGEPPPLR